jgi:hypothetical protein
VDVPLKLPVLHNLLSQNRGLSWRKCICKYPLPTHRQCIACPC